jgi:hypothetical protein
VASRLVLEGLDELRAALRALPEELAREASVIVTTQAEMAKDQIQRAYAQGPTGNLRGRVTVNQEGASNVRFGARAIVRSRAPHAHLYEYGTKNRRTSKGANRGAMPAAPEENRMIPIVVRRRRSMVAGLIEVVRRAGLIVEDQP